MSTQPVSTSAKRAHPGVLIVVGVVGGLVLAVTGLLIVVWLYLPTGPRPFATDEPRLEFVILVNTDDALRAETEAAAESVRDAIGRAGVPGALLSVDAPDRFSISNVADTHQGTVRAAAGSVNPAFEGSAPTAGTTAFIMRAETAREARERAVAGVEQTFGRRLRELGFAKWNVARQGGAEGQLLVQVAARRNADISRIAEVITASGFLQLRLVELGPAPSIPELLQRAGGSFPPLTQVVAGTEPSDTGAPTTVYYLLRTVAVVTGRDIARARATMDESGRPAVSFSLREDGAARLRKATAGNVGRQLAIVFDGRVQSAPRINSAISEEGQITGRFTEAEANDLALLLRSGSLPASVRVVAQHQVGGSSGR